MQWLNRPLTVAIISSTPSWPVGRAITDGVARDGRPLKLPTVYGYHATLKAADLADIIAYLRTVPPLQ